MHLSILIASGFLTHLAAAMVAPRNLVPRKEELCVIPITDCDYKCQGGSQYLNCAASYCKLVDDGTVGVCVCKCKYG